MCPELGSVVEGILPNKALRQDKATYRSQEMRLEAAGPISACLERANEGTTRGHSYATDLPHVDGRCLTTSLP